VLCLVVCRADEFDGNELDGSKWEAMQGDGSAFGIPGWGNNELVSCSLLAPVPLSAVCHAAGDSCQQEH